MKREVNMRVEIAENLEKIKLPSERNEAEKGISTDPFGSWTGVPADGMYEQPVQDVDDL